MIQLKPVPRPAALTDELVHQLTEKFKADKTQRVWDRQFITDALLSMSGRKCCYCECKIEEESKYMEVEHFCCKSIYPDDVLLWPNLLPSCKRCNGNKLDHDVKVKPIIHPVHDDPRDHLDFRGYRFYGKTPVGKMTVEVIYLNEIERLQTKRYEVGAEIKERLDELEEQVRDFLEAAQPLRKQRKILSKLKGIMKQGQPTEEYAATVATEILREDSYPFVKAELVKLDLWDADFQQLEDGLANIAFL